MVCCVLVVCGFCLLVGLVGLCWFAGLCCSLLWVLVGAMLCLDLRLGWLVGFAFGFGYLVYLACCVCCGLFIAGCCFRHSVIVCTCICCGLFGYFGLV